jgi:WD40 repeat protein
MLCITTTVIGDCVLENQQITRIEFSGNGTEIICEGAGGVIAAFLIPERVVAMFTTYPTYSQMPVYSGLVSAQFTAHGTHGNAAFGTTEGTVVMFSQVLPKWHVSEDIQSITIHLLHAPQQHELPACEFKGARYVGNNIGPAAANGRGREILATRANRDIVAICGIQHTTLSDPAVASCSKDGIVMIWTAEGTWHMAMKMQHAVGVNTKIISYSTTVHNEKQILIGVCSDNHVQVWNIDTTRSYSWKPGKSLTTLYATICFETHDKSYAVLCICHACFA